jgi:ribonuclease HI
MINIYTDGACKENKRQDCGDAAGKGGWAFVILGQPDEFSDMEIVMSGSDVTIGTTNQEMEIVAVAEAFEALRYSNPKYDYEGKQIILYSDSAYVVNCLKDKWYINWKSNGWKNSKGKPVENKEAWERLLSAIEGIDVTFFHVRRNSTKFMKMVDEMAKKASKK